MDQSREANLRRAGASPTGRHARGERCYQPLSAAQVADPYPFLEWARQQPSLMYSEAIEAWVVTRYQDVLTVLKDPVAFSSCETLRPVRAHTPQAQAILDQFPTLARAVSSDGEQHRRYRGAFSRAFTKERIAPLEPLIQEMVEDLIEQMVQEGHTEIMASLASPAPLRVILSLLGIPRERLVEMCKRWSDHFLLLISSDLREEQQVAHAHSYGEFCTYLLSLVHERMQTPGNDLISELVTARSPEGIPQFSVAEMMSLLQCLIIAGHETITNFIGNGLKLLLERPALWQRVCAQQVCLPALLEEILRYESPIRGFFRTSTQLVVVGGKTFPPRTRFFLVYASANRDEAHFVGASVFDPERFTPPTRLKHLAFGHGVHACFGAQLARMEGRIIFATLAARLPNLRLVPDQPLEYWPLLLFRGYRKLFVQWDPARLFETACQG